MRSSALVAVLALSLAGCLVGDADSPAPGGDDDTGADPGPGPGPGSGSGSNVLMPRINAAIDKTTVATELGRTEVVTLTLTSIDGFAGDVAVAPSLVDGVGTALANGITVTGQPTVTLAANGTATAMYMLKVPSNATATNLAATLKLDATSSVGAKSLSSAVTVAAIYTLTYEAGIGSDVTKHPQRGTQIAIKKGAKIAYYNADTDQHVTHAGGGGMGTPAPLEAQHQKDIPTNGLNGMTYMVATDAAVVGSSGQLGCHSHGNSTYATFKFE